MTPIKRRLLYIFRNTLLRLRISWPKGNTLTLSVGYHIDRRRWDGSRCTRNSSHGPQQIPAATINRTLQSLEDTITAAFYSFEAKDITPTPAQLKETISPSDSDRTTPSLLAPLAENYIARVSVLSQWSERTRRQTRQALNILIELFGPDARIDRMTDAHIVRLLDYMISRRVFLMKHLGEKTQLRSGLNNNTINHYMTSIRAFANWSVEKGYITSTPLTRLSKKLPVAKNPVIYLTPEEAPPDFRLLLVVPPARGSPPAASHLYVGPHMAVVAERSQIRGGKHPCLSVAPRHPVLHGADVMHLRRGADVTLPRASLAQGVRGQHAPAEPQPPRRGYPSAILRILSHTPPSLISAGSATPSD